MVDKESIILNTLEYIKTAFSQAEGGHDYWHTYRVWNNAKKIALNEKCDLFVVELASLLHDVADSKFNDGDENIGPETARFFLDSQELDIVTINKVVTIINNVSFKGGNTNRSHHSVELDIVQDADRLEAIGAIGIARTFNYGGFIGSEIFNPEIAPNLQMTKEEYKKSKNPTINHFYEKLLLLKDLMNTESGKKLANQRHQFMMEFLSQFYKEASFESIDTSFNI